MIRYPDIQAKVQTELDTVLGQSRAPTLQDRSSLPYTEVNSINGILSNDPNSPLLPAGGDDGGAAVRQHPAHGRAPRGQQGPGGGAHTALVITS